MTEEQQSQEIAEETTLVKSGPTATWLAENGFEAASLAPDHSGVELISIEAESLTATALALYNVGFNYLQCQGAYDLGPGQDLVSFYHLIKVSDDAVKPQEVRLKVFLPRDNPTVSSVYNIWQGADWQERESYDMYGIVYEGHPNLKRILMPEDWVGWPMRKDYISPDFYELQDAY